MANDNIYNSDGRSYTIDLGSPLEDKMIKFNSEAELKKYCLDNFALDEIYSDSEILDYIYDKPALLQDMADMGNEDQYWQTVRIH